MKRVVKADGRVLIMEHEVPKKRFIKMLFYIRMMIIGSKNAREFLNQGLSPFKQIFLHRLPYPIPCPEKVNLLSAGNRNVIPI